MTLLLFILVGRAWGWGFCFVLFCFVCFFFGGGGGGGRGGFMSSARANSVKIQLSNTRI